MEPKKLLLNREALSMMTEQALAEIKAREEAAAIERKERLQVAINRRIEEVEGVLVRAATKGERSAKISLDESVVEYIHDLLLHGLVQKLDEVELLLVRELLWRKFKMSVDEKEDQYWLTISW